MKECLLVSKDILPDYFDKVLEAKSLIENSGLSVTEACEKENISRSTYYKYRDKVSLPNESAYKRAIFNFKVDNTPGVLSALLNTVYYHKGNVLSINQEVPLHNTAYISVMIDIKDLNIQIDELINEFKKVPHIKKAELIDYE